MARPMPVLPDEGSMRIWSGWPGLRMPSLSAISIIDSATRSLTDPPGFCPSSLMNSRASGFGLSALISTSGVSPISPSTDSSRATDLTRPASSPRPGSAAGHGRQDRDLGAIGDGRVQTLQVPHVIVVHVDVDELVKGPGVLQHLAR